MYKCYIYQIIYGNIQFFHTLKVKDNGLGIPECDRQAMAMRYHTSKLSDFEGLSRVETYGFRGTTNQKINFYNIIH